MKCPCKKGIIFRAFRFMKRLVIIRHAEALPEKFPQKDADRDLSENGLKEATFLAAFLAGTAAIHANLLLCSSARRTRSTAEILHEKLSLPARMQAVESLYNAGYQAILQQVKSLPAEVEMVLLVGHNPGVSQVASVLSDGRSYQFSTASCLCLEFPFSQWNEIQHGTGKEVWYFSPY